MDEKIPILKGYMGATTISVWCPYCRTDHVHGIKELGGRGAHCDRDSGSPFVQTGYAIKPFTKKEIAAIVASTHK